MITVAIGPQTKSPSWDWVGFDTSRELSKYFNVVNFEYAKYPVQADVIIIIKKPPTLTYIETAKRMGTKTIYCPIDFYQNYSHLMKDGPILKKMDLILTHCSRLDTLFLRHNNNIKFIDHNNKYMLPEIAPYKQEGFVLWVGGCQYSAYLIDWLLRNSVKNEFKICTDLSNGRASHAAIELGKKLGIKIRITDKTINGIEAYDWNERIQYELMKEAKAAIDIKGDGNFNQHCKPPTKAQKFIASGIPFAINQSSYATAYFKKRGFEICTPDNTMRWFSEEYYQKTIKIADKLRKETSLESIGLKFKSYIEELLNDKK